MLPPTITVAGTSRGRRPSECSTLFFTAPATWAESTCEALAEHVPKSSVSPAQKVLHRQQAHRRPAPGLICRNSPRFISLEKEPRSAGEVGRRGASFRRSACRVVGAPWPALRNVEARQEACPRPECCRRSRRRSHSRRRAHPATSCADDRPARIAKGRLGTRQTMLPASTLRLASNSTLPR